MINKPLGEKQQLSVCASTREVLLRFPTLITGIIFTVV